MLAHGILALSLMVRIYDAHGVPGDHLARAKTTVEAIMMKGAGVAVTWPACPCISPVGSGELVIRIAAAPSSSQPGSLGFSTVDTARRTGTLATVFADRVRTIAVTAGIDEGELLGRVIAHEIAHLLIGTRDHGTHGLMRGFWSAHEVAQQHASEWLLSRAEGLEIRQAIWRRSSPSRPAMIAADADMAATGTAQ